MPTLRKGGNRRRRGSRIPEYASVAILEHGHDHFRNLPDTGAYGDSIGPEGMQILKECWADPRIRAQVIEKHKDFVDREGPHPWAARVFDGKREDPKARARREAAQGWRFNSAHQQACAIKGEPGAALDALKRAIVLCSEDEIRNATIIQSDFDAIVASALWASLRKDTASAACTPRPATVASAAGATNCGDPELSEEIDGSESATEGES
jgi:hypothetical protein